MPTAASTSTPIAVDTAMDTVTSTSMPTAASFALPLHDDTQAVPNTLGRTAQSVILCCANSCDRFRPDKKHMKNKFCARCRKGFGAQVVRALTPEFAQTFVNSSTRTVWSHFRHSEGTSLDFRVGNQTKKCRGVWSQSSGRCRPTCRGRSCCQAGYLARRQGPTTWSASSSRMGPSSRLGRSHPAMAQSNHASARRLR